MKLFNWAYKKYITICWHLTDPERRKPWKDFKSGLIKHDCQFEISFEYSGCKFKKCNHPGCNIVIPVEE